MSGDHKGGWEDPVQGSIEGHEVTASFGTGSNEGETLLTDGLVDEDIRQGPHDHYGSGSGPNDNVADRGQYTGPGSRASEGSYDDRIASYLPTKKSGKKRGRR